MKLLIVFYLLRLYNYDRMLSKVRNDEKDSITNDIYKSHLEANAETITNRAEEDSASDDDEGVR